jgi:hypothetical protein
VSGSRAGDGQSSEEDRGVSVRLEGFAREAVEQESARLGVSVDELVAFSVVYYLADVDSGRISRRISRGPMLEGSGLESSEPEGPYPDASP